MPKFRFLDEILSVNLLKLNLLVQDLDQGTGAGKIKSIMILEQEWPVLAQYGMVSCKFRCLRQGVPPVTPADS